MLRRLLFTVTTLGAAWALGGEGKWTPQQVLQQGPQWLRAQGFELPAATLWDEKTQAGLLANAVQLPGCSGSFVSAQGLLITNHHCVVSILQEHSTPGQNLVKDGFVAHGRAEEKRSKAFRVQVPRAFRDVTKEVRAELPDGGDDLTRQKAVEAVQKRLVAECERPAGTRCTFASFDGGLFFTLTEFTELSDVRLVYAPPTAVGDYGGETDNWTWPRHSGDFALVRVYRDDVPFVPTRFFPVSTSGVKPGDAVAVLGYPGVSYRAWLADEMAEREERWFPQLEAMLTEWLAIVDDESRRSPDVAVATADDTRSLVNARKNAAGQQAGLRRGHLVAQQRLTEGRVLAFAAKTPAQRDAAQAHARLEELLGARLATWRHDFLLDLSTRGARALSWPLSLARHTVEAQKPDAAREPGWQERDLPRLKERLERDQKRLAPSVDVRLFVSWLKQARALPEGQRLRAVDAVFGSASSDAELEARALAVVASSKVFDLPERKKMFDETPAQLAARKDPLLDLGLALDEERRALRDARDAATGASVLLRPVWRRAVLAEAGHPVAPDANSTLRVTFGRVKGYQPRDGVSLEPQTTLAGAVEKHTGAEPFDLPAKVREAKEAGRLGRFADARLHDVPVDFLSDCDTTGGNSGSPTIDAHGRLVGVNFDRVWENVANDFGYNPAVARNINADVRYLLWLLEEVEHEPGLVKELTQAP
jgi:hypothetical protein